MLLNPGGKEGRVAGLGRFRGSDSCCFIYLCVRMHAGNHKRAEEGFRPSRAGVAGNQELTDMKAVN